MTRWRLAQKRGSRSPAARCVLEIQINAISHPHLPPDASDLGWDLAPAGAALILQPMTLWPRGWLLPLTHKALIIGLDVCAHACVCVCVSCSAHYATFFIPSSSLSVSYCRSFNSWCWSRFSAVPFISWPKLGAQVGLLTSDQWLRFWPHIKLQSNYKVPRSASKSDTWVYVYRFSLDDSFCIRYESERHGPHTRVLSSWSSSVFIYISISALLLLLLLFSL